MSTKAEKPDEGFYVDEENFRDLTEEEINQLRTLLDKIFGPEGGCPRPYILIVKTAKSVEGISNTPLRNQARLASAVVEMAMEQKLTPLLAMLEGLGRTKN